MLSTLDKLKEKINQSLERPLLERGSSINSTIYRLSSETRYPYSLDILIGGIDLYNGHTFIEVYMKINDKEHEKKLNEPDIKEFLLKKVKVKIVNNIIIKRIWTTPFQIAKQITEENKSFSSKKIIIDNQFQLHVVNNVIGLAGFVFSLVFLGKEKIGNVEKWLIDNKITFGKFTSLLGNNGIGAKKLKRDMALFKLSLQYKNPLSIFKFEIPREYEPIPDMKVELNPDWTKFSGDTPYLYNEISNKDLLKNNDFISSFEQLVFAESKLPISSDLFSGISKEDYENTGSLIFRNTNYNNDRIRISTIIESNGSLMSYPKSLQNSLSPEDFEILISNLGKKLKISLEQGYINYTIPINLALNNNINILEELDLTNLEKSLMTIQKIFKEY